MDEEDGNEEPSATDQEENDEDVGNEDVEIEEAETGDNVENGRTAEEVLAAANEATMNGQQEISEEDYIYDPIYILNNAPPPDYSADMVSQEEIDALVQKDIPPTSDFHPGFDKFCFSPRQVSDEDIPLAIMAMMRELGMIRRWCIKKEALAKFILMARCGYRDNPYHNWRHAFLVTHFSYLLLKNLDLVKSEAVDYLEALALFISAICHDLDHRGTNNAFQKKSNSILYTMNSAESSTLENHHYSQGISILETEGCNILANCTKSEYDQFMEIMKNFIMATDLVNHFRILPDLEFMVEDGTYNPQDPDQHELVLSLLMTSCDLSDQSKDWKSAITSAASVYKEFFAQGDLEKKMGHLPMDMMDRNKAVVTDLQIFFLDKIAIPVYNILYRLFPKSSDAYRGILVNRKKWGRLQFMYNSSIEDPEMEPVDSCDLQAIINEMEFEGAERKY